MESNFADHAEDEECEIRQVITFPNFASSKRRQGTCVMAVTLIPSNSEWQPHHCRKESK